jgi:WD40 repeat protein
VFQRHAAATSIAFAPDGRSILSGGEDKIAELRNVADGKIINTFKGHDDGAIASVAFSPDGRSVLVMSWNFQIWDAASGRPIKSIDGVRGNAFALSPDGRLLVADGEKGLVLWDIASAAQIRSFDGRTGTSFAFAPDGRSVVMGGEDGTLALIDAMSGKPAVAFAGAAEANASLAFAPDGRSFLVGSGQSVLRLWNMMSGKPKAFSATAEVRSVAFAPDGRRLLWGGGSGGDMFDGTIGLLDAASGALIRTFETSGPQVNEVGFAPDGRTIFSVDEEAVKLWDVASGKTLWVSKGGTEACAAVAPDGRSVAVGGQNGALKVLDIADGRAIKTLRAHKEAVSFVSFTPDGRSLLSGSADGVWELWDVASGKSTAKLDTHSASPIAAAVAPDARTVLSWSKDRSLNLFDIVSGAVKTFQTSSAASTVVAFAPDGRVAMTGGDDKTLKLWDIGSGGLLATFFASGENWVVFAPDGRYASSGDLRKMLAIVRGADVLPLDEFIRLNRRDSVADVLSPMP